MTLWVAVTVSGKVVEFYYGEHFVFAAARAQEISKEDLESITRVRKLEVDNGDASATPRK